MENRTLAALSETLVDVINVYIDEGRISRAELIGVLEMIKLGYFREFLEENPEEDEDDFAGDDE